ncbi:MAG: hypothetical protein KAI50_15415 [Desulfobacterales bacterium]|nr:hypothetical protein [Desulfobacterales bacterium]
MEEVHLIKYGVTVVHPIALVSTLSLGLLMFIVPRRIAVVALVFASVFIPMQQRIVFATLDFTMIRLLILFGWIMIIMRAEYRTIELNEIDKFLILWVIANVAIYTIRTQSLGPFINRMGLAFNALGTYFLFRSLVRDFEDIELVIKTLAIASLFLSGFMLIEHFTGRNLFSVFGGVPKFTALREGRLRCQGAFSHPILAGTFGASLLPLFVSLWWYGTREKKIAFLSCIAATIITVTSASSGPAIAYVAGLFALIMWYWRRYLSHLLWVGSLLLIAIHIIMKAPIWSLIARIDVVGGSTGWHRYHLIDQFITRFNEWWLLGVDSTSHWGRALGDVTNYYVQIGVDAGIVTLILFVFLIIKCFKGIGSSLCVFEGQPRKVMVFWAFGASLFVHLISFISVWYFDQMFLIWYMLLAMISTVSTFQKKNDIAANKII